MYVTSLHDPNATYLSVTAGQTYPLSLPLCPFVCRKFLNKTELELRCPNCENYADAFHYYYVHPFRKLLNATELPTLSQLVGEDDNKGRRPIRLSTERRRIHFHEVYVGKIESTPRISNRSQVSKWMPHAAQRWKFQSILCDYSEHG